MYLFLELQQFARRLLTRFHAGLIVGIDVNERTVIADCALIERDQQCDIKSVDLGDTYRN